MAEQQAARRKAESEEELRKKANGLLTPDSIPSASLASPGGRARRAAGWRGLSVDLITGDPDSVAAQLNGGVQKDKGKAKEESDSDSEEEEDLVKVRSRLFKEKSIRASEQVVGKDERLEGPVVKLVWKRSGLEKRRLAEIWCVYETISWRRNLTCFVIGMSATPCKSAPWTSRVSSRACGESTKSSGALKPNSSNPPTILAHWASATAAPTAVERLSFHHATTL